MSPHIKLFAGTKARSRVNALGQSTGIKVKKIEKRIRGLLNLR